MRMIEIDVQVESHADAASVFALLRDGSTWPKWSLFTGFELEQQGVQDPLGVGAIRVFITSISRAREQVVEVIPGRRFSYTLLSGFPFHDYRADVGLEPLASGGTRIAWHSSFYARRLGTGWFWQWFMRRALHDVASQLAKAAEKPEIVASCEDPSPYYVTAQESKSGEPRRSRLLSRDVQTDSFMGQSRGATSGIEPSGEQRPRRGVIAGIRIPVDDCRGTSGGVTYRNHRAA